MHTILPNDVQFYLYATMIAAFALTLLLLRQPRR